MVACVPLEARGLLPQQETPVSALKISSGFCVLKCQPEMSKASACWRDSSQIRTQSRPPLVRQEERPPNLINFGTRLFVRLLDRAGEQVGIRF